MVVVIYTFFIYAVHRIHIVSLCAMILNMLEEKTTLEHVGRHDVCTSITVNKYCEYPCAMNEH